MSKNSSYDIIIIGAGITGLSLGKHLRDLGVSSLLMIDGGAGTSAQSAGFCGATPFDNYTRLSHAHGAMVAKEVWKFHKVSHDYALDRFRLRAQQRVRLLTSHEELKEARLAVDEMVSGGHEASLETHAGGSEWGPGVLGFQHEGLGGAYVEVDKALESLACGIELVEERVIEIRQEKSGLAVELASGREYQAEMVGVCAHLGACDLLPELAEVFISYGEQYSEWDLLGGEVLPPGFCFSAHHGYEWGVFTDRGTIQVGGARFLRKDAGIGVDDIEVEERIENFLSQRMQDYFPNMSLGSKVKSVAGLANRPCDELPVIGPMFGDGRILVAGGFMGLGLTLGLYAGKVLADLMFSGKAPSLPRCLYPERLRSLA